MKSFQRIITQLRDSSAIESILIRGAGLSFGITILTTILSLFARIIFVRFMGTDEYGVYVYALSWANLLMIVSVIGLDITAMRYVGAYWASRDWGHLKGFLRYSTKRVTVASMLISLLLIIPLSIFQKQLDLRFIQVSILLIIVTPINALLQLTSRILIGLQEILIGQGSVRLLGYILLLIGFYITTFVMKLLPTAVIIFALYSIASVVSLAVNSWKIHHKLSPTIANITPKTQMNKWHQASRSLSISAILITLLHHLDIVLVGLFLGTTAAGLYATIVLLLLPFNFAQSSVDRVLAPIISSAYENNDVPKIQKVTKLSTYGIVAYASIFSLVIIIGGRQILNFFDPSYVAGYPALLILSIGAFATAIAGPVELILTMTDKEQLYMKSLAISAAILVILTIILIPNFALVGAASATAITFMLWQVQMVYYTRQYTHINPTIFPFLDTKVG